MFEIFGRDLFLNHIAEVLRVLSHIIDRNDSAFFIRQNIFFVLGVFEYLFDVAALKSALSCEKFQSVSVVRVVACGYLNRRVAAEVDRGHEHRRRRGERAVDDLKSAFGQRGDDLFLYSFSRNSRVVTDRDFVAFFLHTFRQPLGEARRHSENVFVRQVERLVLYRVDGDTSDVRSAFKMLPIFIKHWLFLLLLQAFLQLSPLEIYT